MTVITNGSNKKKFRMLPQYQFLLYACNNNEKAFPQHFKEESLWEPM